MQKRIIFVPNKQLRAKLIAVWLAEVIKRKVKYKIKVTT